MWVWEKAEKILSRAAEEDGIQNNRKVSEHESMNQILQLVTLKIRLIHQKSQKFVNRSREKSLKCCEIIYESRKNNKICQSTVEKKKMLIFDLVWIRFLIIPLNLSNGRWFNA